MLAMVRRMYIVVSSNAVSTKGHTMSKLNAVQVGQVVGALKSYSKKVSKFYALKVEALARRIERTGRVYNAGTVRKALLARSLEVSPFYALKLGVAYNAV